MTDKEKAKAYDEALKKAKEIKEKIMYSHLSTESCKAVSEYIDTIIPELAESEDEKIIDTLIWLVEGRKKSRTTAYGDVKIDDILAWLEKQKEQKPINLHDKIEELCSKYPINKYSMSDKELSAYHQGIHLGATKLAEYLSEQKPAEWSEDDEKMLKSITSDLFCGTDFNIELKSMASKKVNWLKDKLKSLHFPPKQGWSEEDEKRLELVIDCVYEYYPDPVMKYKLKDWLKSLPWNLKKKNEDVAKLCSNEWSEEDRLHYANVLEALEYVKGCKSDYDKIEAVKSDIAWFKSLKPSWKPSEEQMKALTNFIVGDEYDAHALAHLWAELKELSSKD